MKVTISMTGTTPLVMHSDRGVDSTDPIAIAIKEITSKKQKNRTEAEEMELRRLEFHSGLYWSSELGVYIPARNFIKCFQEAATITKDGKNLTRSLSAMSEAFAVIHDGPKTADAMAKDPKYSLRVSVGNQRNRIMRVRPMLRKWATVFEAELSEDSGLPYKSLVQIVERAGRSIGICDARGIGYGRFTSTIKAGE